MKKFLLLLVMFIILSNCEIKLRTAHAYEYKFEHDYAFRIEVHNGMTYGIWYKSDGTTQTGYAIHVVNLTKDQLEVEVLRKQLQQLR